MVNFVGTENVQAAQKYITGLDARRISKFPEHRYPKLLLQKISCTSLVLADAMVFIFAFTSLSNVSNRYYPKLLAKYENEVMIAKKVKMT